MAGNDILERAALALANSQGGPIDSLDELDDAFRAGLIEDVRAVLKAIREPSPEMLAVDPVGPTGSFFMEDVWQGMIDAALAE